MRLSTIPNIGRNANRFREIAQVAAKYGFADWLHTLDADYFRDWFRSGTGEQLADVSREARIRLAFTELGPTFIKLGQMLSTRADLVGPVLAEELQKLQADIPADTPDQLAQTLEEELGAPVETIFDDFDHTPIGSASIGQVHTARLKDGTEVVLKVQHGGVEAIIETDLDILQGIAEIVAERSAELRLYQPKQVIRSFRHNVLQQLDFLREKRNLDQFRANFADDTQIHFPKPYDAFCTRRVLTMERLVGSTLEELRDAEDPPIDPALVARRGAEAYLEMIFRDGFYHADPHPGNFIVLEDGVVGFLDCGLVGRIDPRLRQDFEDVVIDIIQEDTEALVNDIFQIGATPRALDRDVFRSDIAAFVEEYGTQNLADLEIGDALTRLTGLIRQHRIMLPANVSILLRVLIMLDGTGRYVNPDFSLIELIQPYESEVMLRRYSPARMASKLRRRYREFDRLLDTLPADLADIVERLREGRFDVKLEHLRVDATANRLVYGILASALFLGSSQLYSSDTPPTVYGISVFGALGCAAAVGLGARLLYAIHRSGDLVHKERKR